MNRTGAGLLTLAIMVALIVGSGSSSRAGSGTPEEPARVEGSSDQPAGISQSELTNKDCEAQKATFKFQLIDAVRTSFSRGTTGDEQCSTDFQINEDQAKRARVVFAIVPDPMHTSLSLFFDRQIEAIRQGIMDSRWTFERGLMPWDNKDHPEANDFRIRLQQQVYQTVQEEQPGLMIFRHLEKDDKSNDPHRLLVFVIAESPTAGVKKTQFRQAVSLVHEFFSGNIPQEFAIFGPTFSGSLQSLLAVMDCDGKRDFPCNAKVYSGTVTGAPSIQWFRERSGIPFFSLQENDDYVVNVFLDFVHKKWGYSNEQIAILSEDETVYGTWGVKKGPQKQPSPRSETSGTPPAPNVTPNRESGSASGETDCKATSDAKKPAADPQACVVHVYFPREISQLRSAYQHSLNVPKTTDNKTPGRTLPLDLDSSGSDDYAVPAYARRQSPLSQEAMLLALVGELAKDNIQIVLLRATDPLDQFFLSRYLRQAYPNGRIITVSSDLLFSREAEDARLHGVMALTTYPLTPGADHEFQNPVYGHSDRVFASTHSVGSYNAMKLLLAENFHVVEGQTCSGDLEKPSESDPPCVYLYQYGWPREKSARHPPVYLNVLGHDGYWQVVVLPFDSDATKRAETATRSTGLETVEGSSLPPVLNPLHQQKSESGIPDVDSSSPAIWNLLWILAVGISLVYAYFMWSASMLSSSQAVAQLAPSSGNSTPRKNEGGKGVFRDLLSILKEKPPKNHSRRYLLAVAAYLHFALLLALIWPYRYESHGFQRWPQVLLIVALFVVSMVGTCDLWRRDCRRLAVLFAGACIVTLVVFLSISTKDYFHQMAVYRSMHLTSSVSLFFSILLFLAAGQWGVWYSLSGTSLLDSNRTLLPKRAEVKDASLDKLLKDRVHNHRAILEEDQSRLVQLLRPDFFDIRAVLPCVVVAGAVLLFTDFRPIRSLEPRIHEYVLTAMAIGCFAFLVSSAIRLYNIWIELRRLLIALDSYPLRRGFRRMKGLSWSPLWRMGGGNLGDFRKLVSRQAEAWRCVFILKAPQLLAVKDSFVKQAKQTFERYDAALNHYLKIGSDQADAGNASNQAGVDTTGRGIGAASNTTHTGGAATAPARESSEKDHPVEHLKPSPMVALLDRLSFGWLARIREQRREEIALLGEFEKLQQQFASAGLHTLAVAVTQWDNATSWPDEDKEGTRSTPATDVRQPVSEPTTDKFTLRDAAEQFLALLYTNFIMIVLVRIRTLIIAIGGMYVLSLLALTTYPFQPQGSIRIFLLLLFLFMVALVGMVYAQMHRDATLSHITRTTPGQLGTSFWLRIVSFVALPLFSLLASEYPAIGGWLSSWLEPALHALQ